jgi:hypothetical protein
MNTAYVHDRFHGAVARMYDRGRPTRRSSRGPTRMVDFFTFRSDGVRNLAKNRTAGRVLEGRLVLSAGVGTGATSHLVGPLITLPKTISASFTGTGVLKGTKATIENLTGSIGSAHFTGSGTGTVVSQVFKGGTINLKNSLGTIELKVGPEFLAKVGKTEKPEVALTVIKGTGAYKQYLGLKAANTSYSVSGRTEATLKFVGTFKT